MVNNNLSIFNGENLKDYNISINDYIISSGALNFNEINDPNYDAKNLAIANYLEIQKLDNAFSQIYNDFSDIAIVINRLNILENSYNNLDLCLNKLDLCFNKLDLCFNKLDLCFNELFLDVSQNKHIVGISFNIVVDDITDISNRLNNISEEYVNDVSQTFYEIMTQQPYMFNADLISANSNTLT